MIKGYLIKLGKKGILTVILSVFLICGSINGQSYIPDQNFGLDGWVVSNTDDLDDSGYGFDIQDDGKIVVLGLIREDTNDDGTQDFSGFGFIRYNTDGSLDNSFGTDGRVLIDNEGNDQPRDVLIQPDGKILGVGAPNFTVIRLNQDGSLDNSFGTDGIAYFYAVNGRVHTRANTLALTDDNKIMVLGETSSPDGSDLLRLNADGTLDDTFNSSGGVGYDGGIGTVWKAIDVQSDGKVIIGGSYNDGGNRNVAILRYLSDGTLDSSFGTNGIFIEDYGTPLDEINDLEIQDDGKILFTGSAGNIPDREILHGRLNSNGTLDTSWSGDGKGVRVVSGTEVGNEIIRLNDGKVVIGGHGNAGSTNSNNSDFMLYRLNADGSPDVEFNEGSSLIIFDHNGDSDVMREMLLHGNDFYLFGDTEVNFTVEYFALLKVTEKPTQNTIIVTNTNDSGAGSLRQAMLDANNTINGEKPDRIIFEIPDTDPGYDAAAGIWTISPVSGLPEITDPVIINGTNTSLLPTIELDGSGAGEVDALVITAGGSTVSGLVINNYASVAISLEGQGGNTISRNYIGTDKAGESAASNVSFGVFINNVSDNTITNNVLSGNNVGIFAQLDGADSNVMEDNLIGTDKNGGSAIPNEVEGIRLISGADNNLIGSNTISGNGQDGIAIYTGSSGNQILDNRIGTNSDGTAAIPNGISGVFVENSNDNEIGGETSAARNIISGNTNSGIYVTGTSNGNLIGNNFIGLNQSGSAAVGNGTGGGIILNSTEGNQVTENLISGNGGAPGEAGSGVTITSVSKNNSVRDNLIGFNSSGNVDIGNANNGIRIHGDNNLVRGNYISGNGRSAIEIPGGFSNTVCGNYIGIMFGSVSMMPNDYYGIWLNSGASENTIGGSSSGCGGNVIADDLIGIQVGGVDTKDNIIIGNIIGTDQSGQNIYEGETGIIVRDATSNLVGTLESGNTIVNQTRYGVAVRNNSGQAINNSIRGNVFSSIGNIGIDLAVDQITANDDGDGDTGPNNLQNYPEIESAEFDTLTTEIKVRFFVNSLPANSSYPMNIDIYINEGNRLAVTYLGSTEYLETDAGDTIEAIFGVPTELIDTENGAEIIAVATDNDGNSSEFSEPISVTNPMVVSNEKETGVPSEFELLQNYPNPFNPTTVISFGLPVASEVQVNIFNVLGQRVSTLVDQRLNAGFHEFDFDASGLPSGIYLYRIQTDEYTAIKKMMLVK